MMRRDNPHITYHSNKRGYIACTATAALMKADFRIVDRVTVAESTGAHVAHHGGRSGPGRQHDFVDA